MASIDTKKKPSDYLLYHTKVLKKRLRYINKINFLIAIFCSIILKLPSGNIIWNIIISVLFKSPLIYISLQLIKQSRNKFLFVEFSKQKTLISQLYKTFFSIFFLKNLIYYLLSAFTIRIFFISQFDFKFNHYSLSKDYHRKLYINDLCFFFWFNSFFGAVFYTLVFLTFQWNKLDFQYGIAKKSINKNLIYKIPKLFIKTLYMFFYVALLGPIFYWILRPMIYNFFFSIAFILGRDSYLPSFFFSFKAYLMLCFETIIMFFLWEVSNYVFFIYSTIGCLDGKKLISTYSSDPINTLISGLQDSKKFNELCKATAFQELMFISTSNDKERTKYRMSIYNARSKKGFLFHTILTECFLVIKETNERLNFRSSSDLNALSQNRFLFKKTSNDASKVNYESNFNSYKNLKQDINIENNGIDIHDSSFNFFESKILKHLFFFLKQNFNYRMLYKIRNKLKWLVFIDKKKNMFFFYHKFLDLLSSFMFFFFKISLDTDTKSRVLNVVNYGNAIISISHLILNSFEEDIKMNIKNNEISSVLNILEKTICITSNYIDFPPESVYNSDSEKKGKMIKKHLVVELHDMAINQFFQLCIKFNFKLNDLILDEKTYKLAKWITDVVIFHQDNQKADKLSINI